MHKEYKSEALAAIHETVEGLYEIGLVDKAVMKEFDDDCLAPSEKTALKKLRPRGKASRKTLEAALTE